MLGYAKQKLKERKLKPRWSHVRMGCKAKNAAWGQLLEVLHVTAPPAGRLLQRLCAAPTWQFTRGAPKSCMLSCHGQRWGMQKASGANRHIFQSVGFKMNNYCECAGVRLWPHMSRCMQGSGYGSPK